MKILYVSSEVVPFAKTGGLADVAAALPKAIKKIGHDIRIFMPCYKKIDRDKFKLKPIGNGIYEAQLPDTKVVVYLFEDQHFSKRTGLYVLNGKDYPDNAAAFLGFCQAVVPFLEHIDWRPDIIHCNDWQSAPITSFVAEQRKRNPFLKRTATVYSIHNIAYQGRFPDNLKLLGRPSFAEFGIENADVINTVSQTYAQEIQTKEYGYGMEELLKKRSRDVYGIVNGVDYDLWNPATDQKIIKRYSKMTLSLKINNKGPLQKELNLPVNSEIPLLGIISRLDVQKGFDILAEAIPALMQLNCQLIILGTGDPTYHQLLQQFKEKYPERIGLKLGFDAALAQQIYAGTDMFLMPSKYEPCGLGQLISFKYGTIPIVRKTGGLADTVHDYNPTTAEGDGFVFEAYNAQSFLEAVKRALAIYQNKGAWEKLQKKVMDYDYSWDASAKKYISLYMKAFDKVLK